VAAHLVATEYAHSGNFLESFRTVVKRLHGAFTILVIHQDEPGVVLAARRNAPLVIGLGDGENFLGSDVAAFVEHTKRAIAVGQDEIVILKADSVSIENFEGQKVTEEEFTVDWDASAASKGGWSSFMAKEIADQPQAVGDTLMARVSSDGVVKLKELDGIAELIPNIDRIIMIACGTAAYASEVGKYAIEAWAKIPVSVELSHEFRYRQPILTKNTLVVAVRQSGETMDTLMATRYAKEAGATVLSICNTQGATLAREADAVVYTHAGPEIAVASTKALLTQIVAVYLLGLKLAQVRKELSDKEVKTIYHQMLELPGQIEQILETVEPLRELTRKLATSETVLFLGRNVGFPVALEGALKLKELAYIHAEGFAGGELKHGPIALIDSEKQTPVIAILPAGHENALDEKMLSNIQEVKARGARVIVIAQEGDVVVGAEHIIRIPAGPALLQPILATVPLQVFAYEMAVARGNDVDQPRNLAKSVTVE
jgi:glucosamine--fructose-6-phosphate aminotransferase (isomerizing)